MLNYNLSQLNKALLPLIRFLWLCHGHFQDKDISCESHLSNLVMGKSVFYEFWLVFQKWSSSKTMALIPISNIVITSDLNYCEVDSIWSLFEDSLFLNCSVNPKIVWAHFSWRSLFAIWNCPHSEISFRCFCCVRMKDKAFPHSWLSVAKRNSKWVTLTFPLPEKRALILN